MQRMNSKTKMHKYNTFSGKSTSKLTKMLQNMEKKNCTITEKEKKKEIMSNSIDKCLQSYQQSEKINLETQYDILVQKFEKLNEQMCFMMMKSEQNRCQVQKMRKIIFGEECQIKRLKTIRKMPKSPKFVSSSDNLNPLYLPLSSCQENPESQKQKCSNFHSQNGKFKFVPTFTQPKNNHIEKKQKKGINKSMSKAIAQRMETIG